MDHNQKDDYTHFGYQSVKAEKKQTLVDEVFHSVAQKYDVMNDFMSLGIHRLWKRKTIELSGVRPGHRVLDLAGGTGDLAIKFSEHVGSQGQVVLADINRSMLEVGRDRLANKGAVGHISYVQADAQALPFKEASFDVVTIAFGLRNVTNKAVALRSMTRVLKPGGRLLVLEFSKPPNAMIKKVYDAYSFKVLPWLGKKIVDDADSYRYLVESIRKHPDQKTLKHMMQEAGLVRCSYQNMTAGIVALHRGIKPL